MCFMPFLATKSVPTTVPLLEHPPGTALHPLQEQYAAVRDKFSLLHVTELKLAQGCGCWLRNVDCDEPDELVELILSRPDYDPAEKQANHDSLADYLEGHFREDGFVEFFGYFEGDATQPPRAHKELQVAAIRHPQFHFHGGTLYRFTFQ